MFENFAASYLAIGHIYHRRCEAKVAKIGQRKVATNDAADLRKLGVFFARLIIRDAVLGTMSV